MSTIYYVDEQWINGYETFVMIDAILLYYHSYITFISFLSYYNLEQLLRNFTPYNVIKRKKDGLWSYEGKWSLRCYMVLND